MLYDFHQHENSKKPNSVNATYLLTGVLEKQNSLKDQGQFKDGEDEIMQSSPFMSSQAVPDDESSEEEIQETSVLLVREDELQDAKDKYRTIYSIFMYSVQPASPPDLHAVADITALISTQDPLQYGLMYGMIQNKNVKRRTGPVPAPALVSAKPKVPKQAVVKQEEKSQEEPKAETKREIGSRPASRQSSGSQTTAKVSQRPAPSKNASSDLFKAFAKAKPKIKKAEPATAPGVESGEPSGVEDVVMDDDSEEEREDLFLDTGERTTNKTRESRKEREEKLRKMMDDDDDDEMPDVQEDVQEESPSASGETSQADKEKPEPAENSSESAPVRSTGRRRGKRRVMKKKTFKDDKGYLVTKEEPVWESFSEDEPEPPKKRPFPAPSGGKAAKGGQKSSQGSIMSFFGRK
ncbi:predicted protein [Uncinocarpus reesii 1704]|uniref:DNA polymerase delta subunit 3 n=1 Tax=Uncinocarpus reesii (strain UAMH 1704) TaxID=336963 RepID=C4JUQ7_UNCRE|nr:uncharacterized protein UREG_04860 [Uncinocarpus reesii 1704]EEP80018.1 predicted protein [Uncinocarpus reesii 1704]